MGVSVGKTMPGTVVEVDSGVKVFRGVDVTVVVGGIASCVRMEAASAVCTMDVLIAFESSGGTGVTMDGVQARIKTNAMLHSMNFLPVSVILGRSP